LSHKKHLKRAWSHFGRGEVIVPRRGGAGNGPQGGTTLLSHRSGGALTDLRRGSEEREGKMCFAEGRKHFDEKKKSQVLAIN